MRLPAKAPTLSEMFTSLMAKDKFADELIDRLQSEDNTPTPGGRYRHWQKLQYLEPPDGLTHEMWWLGIKLARQSLLRPWPLRDLQGDPFRFAIPDNLFELLHQIDRQAAGAFAGENSLPEGREKAAFLMRSLQEEAITSSQLEGAVTTRKAAKRMLREERRPRDKSEQMIHNNYQAMLFVTQKAKHRRLDPELVTEIHGILTEGTLDDPKAELPERLRNMCAFANNEDQGPFVHPVIRSILLHFWLAYDHPFVDGNGRTARALFYWSMARQGYWLIEYTSISRLLLRARSRYSRAFLYSETDENDATYFVLHQARTILQAIAELHIYLERKAKDRRRSLEILQDSGALNLGLNHRQLALIRHATDHPGDQYSIRTHKRYHNVSYQTARTDLLGIAEAGLLLQTKVGREFIFLAPDDLQERLAAAARR